MTENRGEEQHSAQSRKSSLPPMGGSENAIPPREAQDSGCNPSERENCRWFNQRDLEKGGDGSKPRRTSAWARYEFQKPGGQDYQSQRLEYKILLILNAFAKNVREQRNGYDCSEPRGFDNTYAISRHHLVNKESV